MISDEKEALLAAKAAGRAVIGLWRPGQEMEDLAAAAYVVEDPEDITENYLERVVRRHLGLPWQICETDRLIIREMFADDFDEIWNYRIGRGFGSVEELQAYTKNQYTFYEFGFWALVLKDTGELAGVAGLTLPEDAPDGQTEIYELPVKEFQRPAGETDRKPNWKYEGSGKPDQEADVEPGKETDTDPDQEVRNGRESGGNRDQACEEPLELGYHIFHKYRQKGYAKEACKGIIRYGTEELGVTRFTVRIAKENKKSRYLARSLGFQKISQSENQE